mmetsp:Transcript_11898/g.27332  ORF Transcript_11898/g.27332 Transcript_11898/m.27332 type:complete len:88 (-) Transcript_11898:207-470(-)
MVRALLFGRPIESTLLEEPQKCYEMLLRYASNWSMRFELAPIGSYETLRRSALCSSQQDLSGALGNRRTVHAGPALNVERRRCHHSS